MTEELYKNIEEQLTETKEDLEFLEKSCETMILENPFITDASAVPSSRLMSIIEHSVLHIIKQINPAYKPEDDENGFLGYYIWEEDFGGLIEVDGKEFHLDLIPEFVEYVREYL